MKLLEEFRPSPIVAYLLLVAAAFAWGSSTVVVRAYHTEIPPVGITFYRGMLAALIILPFGWQEIRDQLPRIKKHWRFLLLLAVLQIWSQAIFFWGLNFKSARLKMG